MILRVYNGADAFNFGFVLRENVRKNEHLWLKNEKGRNLPLFFQNIFGKMRY